MTDVFPYRFIATEGLYAGTTFVYPGGDTVISYRTDAPTCYFRGKSPSSGWGLWPERVDMTPAALARFEAIPLRAGEEGGTS